MWDEVGEKLGEGRSQELHEKACETMCKSLNQLTLDFLSYKERDLPRRPGRGTKIPPAEEQLKPVCHNC